MMDSDNRNALDNYGVWVKKAPKDIPTGNNIDESKKEDNFDISADLPDFSSLDNLANGSSSAASFDSGDTSLTSEELLNITGNIGSTAVQEEPAAREDFSEPNAAKENADA